VLTGRRPELGVCTWIFGDHDHPRIAAEVAGLGLEGVEVYADPDTSSAEELARVYGDAGLQLFSVTPQNVDIVHPAHGSSGVEAYKRLIDFAARMGAPAITVHEYVGRGEPCDSGDWERLVSAVQELSRFAHAHGVQLWFEPLSAPVVAWIHTSHDMTRLLEAVDEPALGVVLDIHHMLRADDAICPGIQRCADQLLSLQISNQQRKPVGAGVDWRAIAAATPPELPWVLECAVGLVGPHPTVRDVPAAALRAALSDSISYLNQTLGPR